jgi:hypothetical protein
MTSFNKVYYSECVLERINAMRMREENAIRCRDYLTPLVDATYRKLMVDWCFNVADAFALSRNTVGAAVSIFDRCVSSGNGQSHEALKSTKKFQLAVVASFFVAMKLHEPEPSVLGITSFVVAMKLHEPEPSIIGMQSLVKLCLGVNEESDIPIGTRNFVRPRMASVRILNHADGVREALRGRAAPNVRRRSRRPYS